MRQSVVKSDWFEKNWVFFLVFKGHLKAIGLNTPYILGGQPPKIVGRVDGYGMWAVCYLQLCSAGAYRVPSRHEAGRQG